MTCIVFGCPNGNNTDKINQTVDYFEFPKNTKIQQQWIQACRLEADQIDLNSATICALHFDVDSYIYKYESGEIVKTLKKNAIPTLHLPTEIIINQIDDDPVIDPKKQNGDKYKQIKTCQQLSNLIRENKRIREKVSALEKRIEINKALLEKKQTLFNNLEVEVKKAQQKYRKVESTMLTVKEQRQLLSKVFSERQIKMLTGKKRVDWTDDDMAVGFTIRHLSNRRCYLYITKNLNIPLPGISSIKHWMRKKINNNQ